MDKSVKAIRPADFDLSQIQDNQNSLLQQILDFLNGNTAGQMQFQNATQAGPNNNPPKVLKKAGLVVRGDPNRTGASVVIGDPATPQKAAVGADVLVNGNYIQKSTAVNGFVITPFDTGPSFYVTNPAGTSALFVVNGDGTASCQGLTSLGTLSSFNVVSSQGFKQTVSMGNYWNTNTASGQNFFTQTPIINVNGGGTGYITRKYTALRAGSVTGVSVNMNNSVNSNLGWIIYKNGASVIQAIVNSGQTIGYATAAKGALPFRDGDVFTCQINTAAGLNFAGHCDMEIETGA